LFQIRANSLRLWPGLPAIWRRGSWRSLALAILFAAALNLALVATCVWPELIDATVRTGLWWALSAVWAVSAVCARLPLSDSAGSSSQVASTDLFCAARGEYLQGDLRAAQIKLRELLQAAPDDADGLLLLATVQRRLGAAAAAHAVLKRLVRLDASAKWWFEIGRERQLLAQLSQTATDQDDQNDQAAHEQQPSPADAEPSAHGPDQTERSPGAAA